MRPAFIMPVPKVTASRASIVTDLAKLEAWMAWKIFCCRVCAACACAFVPWSAPSISAPRAISAQSFPSGNRRPTIRSASFSFARISVPSQRWSWRGLPRDVETPVPIASL